jgi:hypothetical protein
VTVNVKDEDSGDMGEISENWFNDDLAQVLNSHWKSLVYRGRDMNFSEATLIDKKPIHDCSILIRPQIFMLLSGLISN